ncbi:MAG: hypothetical protein KF874_06140 [Rhizobiaceae bacterium]|nr:hypothetical protein [Rhizobiaceae bacterium]
MALNLVVIARYLGPNHGALAADLKPYFYCPACRAAGFADGQIAFFHHASTAPRSILCEVVEDDLYHRTAA